MFAKQVARILFRSHQACLPSTCILAALPLDPSPSHPFPGTLGLLAECRHSFVPRLPITYNKIVKNKLLMKKVTDHPLEDLMDDEKKLRLIERLVAVLLKQPEGKMLYRYMIRRGKDVGLQKPRKLSDVLPRYPLIFSIYSDSDGMERWIELAEPVLEWMDEAKELKERLLPRAIPRLKKLLMMSSTMRLRLDHIANLKRDLGLPDDFQQSIIESYPEDFKIIDRGEDVSPLVELLTWDPNLAVTAIEKHRRKEALEKGFSDEEVQQAAFSFPLQYPPHFKIKKGYRGLARRWQEIPYRSPYEDPSDLDLQSPEAFKRAVAVLHEYLSITLDKRTKMNRFPHLRQDMMLPQKVGATVLKHPGIFYYSIKGPSHTIFLREAYGKGMLIEKDPLHAITDKFTDLVMMGRRNIKREKRLRRAKLREQKNVVEVEGKGATDVDNSLDKMAKQERDGVFKRKEAKILAMEEYVSAIEKEIELDNYYLHGSKLSEDRCTDNNQFSANSNDEKYDSEEYESSDERTFVSPAVK